MKRTYRKNVLRTVKSSISRFGAIVAIVALGSGFFAGLLTTTPDMRYSADLFFDEGRLFDIRVVGTLALTQDDADAIRAVEGVEEMMPAYSADAVVNTSGGDTLVTRFHSLLMDQIEAKEPVGYLNRLEVVEGRLPVRDNECVVVLNNELTGAPVSVGETLTIAPDSPNTQTNFSRTEYLVTGVVTSPSYFSIEQESSSVGNGSIAMILYTGEQNFALEAYTDIYLTVDGAAAENSLQDSYETLVDETVARIEAIAGERCEIRYNEVYTQTREELDKARKEYEDAKEQAEAEFSAAEQKLADGREEIEDNEALLNSAKTQIEQGEAQLKQSQATLSSELTQKTADLSAGKAQLVQAKAQYEQNAALVADQEAQLNEAKQQLAQAQSLVSTLEPMLANAQSAVTAAQAQIPALEQQAAALKTVSDAAQAEYDSALAASPIQQLERTYQEAQAAVDTARGDLTEEEWAAQDPVGSAPLLAARDSAKQAYEAEQQRLAALQTAAATAKAQADAANGTLAAAQQGLAAAQQTVNDTQAQLDSAKQQIAENTPKIEQGEQQIALAKSQLADAQAQITAAEAQLAAGETSLNLAPDLARLQMELAQAQLENSKEEVADGEQQLTQAKEELAKGESEYASQKADAQAQLDDALKQIEDGERALAELEVPEWYVLTRMANTSFVSFSSNVEKVEAIAAVFPIFFFLVAALVSLTTMTRMVEEERTQIGTMKALGYSSFDIMKKYLLYAVAATGSGCIIGISIGLFLFPTVIWNAYTMMYLLPPLHYLFDAPVALTACGLALVSTLAATLNASVATLRENAGALLLPKAPRAGKRILLERISPIWNRMKFTHKVTARNLFRYKKRFFMTVIGIAGCTALLVTGFGLHDSISDIVYQQFGSIFTYDLTAALKDPDKGIEDDLSSVLSNGELVESYLLVHQENSENDLDGETFSTTLFVPENSALFDTFVTLKDRLSQSSVPFSESGVVITEKMSERMNAKIGDTITLSNSNGEQADFRVDGVAENYVQNYVYLSEETYRNAFGNAPSFDTILLRAADSTEEGHDKLSEALLSAGGISGVSFISDLKASFENMLEKINIIVVVLIVSAGTLAFVVLYNLTNINITERTKEIATIKVLGFFDREVSAYVYRESAALAVIGTFFGLIFGIFLHMFVVQSVEVDAVMFGRTIKALSYVFSAALTIIFSVLVNLVMHRKLRRINMVESMKAPE